MALRVRIGLSWLIWGLGGLDESETAEARAGFVEVVVLLGEAETEQVFAAAGAEEGAPGDGGYARGSEQIAGLFGGGGSG